jgi:2-oxoisovalerate dehydrogenase E1 component
VHWSLRAASQLKDEHGIDTEVIDLRSLLPLDVDTIVESVRKTSKALVVHEDKEFSGFGGEVVAQITAKCFEYLDAPVMRVGAAFTPVPFSKILERSVLPQPDQIYNRALEVASY